MLEKWLIGQMFMLNCLDNCGKANQIIGLEFVLEGSGLGGYWSLGLGFWG